MRPLGLAGLALIAAGLFGLVLERLVFTGQLEIIRAGSIKVLAKTDRFFPLPTIVGVLAVVAGIALVYLGHIRKRAGGAEERELAPSRAPASSLLSQRRR